MLIASSIRKKDESGYDREGNLRFGMVLFLAALAMFFVAMIGATIVFRKGLPAWPPEGIQRVPVGLAALNTVILLASSVFMVWAQRDVQAGRGTYKLNLFVTLFLGLTFLGIQAYIYSWLFERGLSATIHLYGSVFFVMTGAHALHIAGGLIALLVVCVQAVREKYAPGNALGIELCGMYWHFMDLVWVGLFVTIILA